MKQLDKYKLEAVNHDGSESVIVWTSNDRDYLIELAETMSADEIMNEFNELPKMLNGDTLELYVDYNDDDSTRDIACIRQFIMTDTGVI
ncbi:MAG: hypothetical protein HOI55_00025 [Candidatus Marinimicrobia bacterium]|jgi:hypothetical protein|nr:hypothetical protein [Candidatus Neomarinimicrobiota bacterium]